MNRTTLYFIVGVLAVVAIGLAVYVYREESEPKGVELNIDKSGISVEQK